MSGVCSAHQQALSECAACFSTPAAILSITEDEWAAAMVRAEASGTVICPRCHFEQYHHGWDCIKCGATADTLLPVVPMDR